MAGSPANTVKYHAGNLSYGVSVLFMSGTLVQAFLKNNGCTDAQVAFYSLVAGLANMLGYMSTFFFADRVRRIKLACVLSILPQLTVPMILSFYAFRAGLQSDSLYPSLLLGTVALNLFASIQAVFGTRILYRISRPAHFTNLTLVSGMITSVGAILASLWMASLFSTVGFSPGVRILFPAGVFLLAGATVLTAWLREREPAVPAEAVPPITVRSVAAQLGRRDFRLMLPPSFLRGVAIVALDYAVIFGINEAGLAAGDSSRLILLSRVAYILGCLLYLGLRRCSHSALIFWGTGAVALALPATLAFPGTAGFYVFYTAAYIGRTVVDNGIPLLTYQTIEENIMGSFSTLRLLAMALGGMLGNLLLGLLYGRIGAMALLAAASVLYFISGGGYYYAARVLRPASSHSP